MTNHSRVCSSTLHWLDHMRIKVMAVSPGGGPLVFQAGYHPRKRTFKTHPYFSGMKIDPKYAFLHAFFSIFHHVLFKICQYDQKHTLFSNFVCFCTPKRCTPVHWLVLKNNPSNNVNFFTRMISNYVEPWGGGDFHRNAIRGCAAQMGRFWTKNP